MQTAEKVGIGVAAAAMVGLMGVLIGTRPDVPDPPPRSESSLASVGGKVQTISTGAAVDVNGYLQPGVRTVVEFTADW